MKRGFALSVLLTIAALAASLYVWFGAYDHLRECVPTHWGITGQADHWVDRSELLPYLLLPPGVMVVTLVLWKLLPWLSPRRFEVNTFRTTYDTLLGLLVALFAFLHAALLYTYLTPESEPIRLIVAGICLFVVVMGNLLGKVKRNFWLGIRTPWTLASEPVWERTHRLGAWLFVGVGLFGIVATLLGLPLLIPFVLIVCAALTTVLYSLVVYKRLEHAGRLGIGPEPQPLEEQS